MNVCADFWADAERRVGGSAGRRVGEHRARMHEPVLEVGRHAGGAARRGGRGGLTEGGDPAVEDVVPAGQRRLLAGRRELDVDGIVYGHRGAPRAAVQPAGIEPLDVPASVASGPRHPWPAHALRNGVHTVNGPPSDFATRPGATA